MALQSIECDKINKYRVDYAPFAWYLCTDPFSFLHFLITFWTNSIDVRDWKSHCIYAEVNNWFEHRTVSLAHRKVDAF